VPALTPFPRKSHRLLFNRERMPPPKLPLTTIFEPDPIYPCSFIYPSCFGSLLATSVPANISDNTSLRRLSFFLGKRGLRDVGPDRCDLRENAGSYIFNTSRAHHANENRSRYSRFSRLLFTRRFKEGRLLTHRFLLQCGKRCGEIRSRSPRGAAIMFLSLR